MMACSKNVYGIVEKFVERAREIKIQYDFYYKFFFVMLRGFFLGGNRTSLDSDTNRGHLLSRRLVSRQKNNKFLQNQPLDSHVCLA